MRTPPLEPSVVGDRLGMAIGHVERLERLIGELLDVSRITTGRLAMQVEEVDLVSLAREVIDRFNDEAAGRRGAPVTLLGPGGAVVGRWDRMRVEQVLSNLVSNAIKYGAGKPVTVALDGDSGGAIAKIVVVDHGIGIGAVDQERIFGRFERAVSSRHYGGLGLGLWIVRQIVEAQGGTIAVRSEPGVETVFTVELPRG